MEKELLNQIVSHFTELYSEEIHNGEVSSDMISEWWGMTCDQYGYSQENRSEVFYEIENAIFENMYNF